VVGGAGYIGSHAARALRRSGYEVLIYDNLSTGFRRLAHGFELVEGDIADQSRLERVLTRVDAVLHFAAHAYVGESVENPRKYFVNNVASALSLLNSVMDAGIRRIVFSSSCAVYGVPGEMPITERTPREPVNPYGASKLFFENALEAYCAYGLRSVSLRYFNAAGADASGEIGELHQPESHLIPLALAACGESGPALQVYGADYPTADGTCIRDYIHVSDLARAHSDALRYLRDGGASLTANCGYGHGFSVLEVIDTVKRVAGVDFPVAIAPRREGDPAQIVADSRRVRETLGWQPRFDDLSVIVAHALAWEQTLSKRRRSVAQSGDRHTMASSARR
jgi:UDP-arabinose 4-epimerase